MTTIARTRRLRSGLEATLGGVCATLLAIMVLNVSWQVFSRYALAAPSSTTEELARFLLIWLGLLGGAYALARRQHVAIEVLARLLPQRLLGGAAPQMAQLAVLVFAIAVPLAGGLRLVLLVLALDQRSAALGVPLGWVYLALPISGVLFAVFALCDLIAPPEISP